VAGTVAAPTGVDRCVERLERELPRRWKGHLGPQLDWSFEGVDLAGKTMLDIGAGTGHHSFYAAARGARVVSLEPEIEGSSGAAVETFTRLRAELGVEGRVMLLRERLQDYDAEGRQFDVVLLASSINHLDEEACINLLREPEAVRIYRGLFERLNELTAPGGVIMLSDASRHNFFAALHLRNPLARTIEWHKHQTPETWIQLLLGAGFRSPELRWVTLGPLRYARPLLANRVASYFLQSTFQLRASKLANPRRRALATPGAGETAGEVRTELTGARPHLARRHNE
jgi:SAM-dependent methyltransferase